MTSPSPPDDQNDEETFALVKIRSRDDVLRIYRYLLNAGFSDISFVKKHSQGLFVPDMDLEQNGLINVVKRRRKCNGDDSKENSVFELSDIAQDSLTKDTSSSQMTATASAEESDSDQVSASEKNAPSRSGTSVPSDAPNIPSPIPFVARPRGSRIQHGVDPSLYAACKLCNNKIMSSRLSNLTNHVRRHAALKQYQCCHCVYSHNEMAKVRLHMHNNHQDYESNPIDGMCREMQQQWSHLMEQCFPGHAKRFAQNNSFVVSEFPDNSSKSGTECSTKNAKNNNVVASSENNDSVRPVSPTELFTCVKCGVAVQGVRLMKHLVKRHAQECQTFMCTECRYLANEPWKVILHITNVHGEQLNENSVIMTPGGMNYVICVPQFFPEFARRRGFFQEDQTLRREYLSLCQSKFGDELDKHTVQCQLCFKQFTTDQNISLLLNHVKHHFGLKHFTCDECSYNSADYAVVLTHLASKHPESTSVPVDKSADFHSSSWQKLTSTCFPSMQCRMQPAKPRTARTTVFSS